MGSVFGVGDEGDDVDDVPKENSIFFGKQRQKRDISAAK